MAEGGNSILELGYDAAAALTKYTAVKLSDDMTVTPVTAIGDLWIGISQFSVTAGEILEGKGATVWLMGVSLVKVGVAVTRGTMCGLTAAGLAQPTGVGTRPIGLVLVSGVANDYVPVLLTPGLPVT